MCNVCVADAALDVTRCGSDKCAAFRDGHRIDWSDAPKKMVPPHAYHMRNGSKRRSRRSRSKLMNNVLVAQPTVVHIRARGKGSEFVPAEYQIRRDHEGWPKKWQKTDDLAGSMGMLGLDVKWKFGNKDVQAWIRGERKECPTEKEMRAAAELRKNAFEAKYGKYLLVTADKSGLQTFTRTKTPPGPNDFQVGSDPNAYSKTKLKPLKWRGRGKVRIRVAGPRRSARKHKTARVHVRVGKTNLAISVNKSGRVKVAKA